jgi:hypothetical protein
MPKAIDFTSISMRAPPGSAREPASGAGGLAWLYGHCLQRALRPGAAQPPPASQWSAAADAASRAFRCSFVRPAWTASRYILWRRPSCRFEGPAFLGKLAV